MKTLSIDTIVVPQGAEYQAVCRGLQQANINGNNIQIITIPIGTKNVEKVLSGYCEQLNNASQVLIIGLCGSLAESYAVGDRVLVKSCVNLAHQLVHFDSKLTNPIQQKLLIDVVAGLTSDRIIVQAEEKLELSQQYPVMVVEMEGYGYATALQKQGKSVAMLRVVSDDLQGDIPDLTQAIDRQGNIRYLPMAIAFFKQPLAAIRLIRGSLTGLKVLRQTTVRLFI